jgi:hypothetical protein
MNSARKIYRRRFVESLILLAVLLQVISGITLVILKWNKVKIIFDRIQIASGLYLSFFLLNHVIAVLRGRYILKMDTNLYYGRCDEHVATETIFYSVLLLCYPVLLFSCGLCTSYKNGKYAALPVATKQAFMIMGIGMLVTLLVIIKMSNLKISFHKTS